MVVTREILGLTRIKSRGIYLEWPSLTVSSPSLGEMLRLVESQSRKRRGKKRM